MIFLLVGLHQEQSPFAQPLPRDLVELKERIIGAFADVTGDVLFRVSEKMEYRLDICGAKKGAHIIFVRYGNTVRRCCRNLPHIT